nr:Hint domain-containing protein [Bradyrhizobium symbiodeficiens]
MNISLDATAAAAASGAGITVNYVAATGVLTLTGTNEATSTWQTILRGILFNDTSGTPIDPGTVTVTARNAGSGNTGVDTQALHLDPAPVNQFQWNQTNADQFTTASYSLNTGTNNWAGGWTESGDGTSSPTAGNILISGGQLILGDTSASITREASANLANATSAKLSFTYTSNSSQASEAGTVQVSTNGFTWATIGTFGGNGADGTFQADLTSYISATTYVRLVSTSGLDSGEFFTVDNLTLAYSGAAPTTLPTQTVNWQSSGNIVFSSANGNEIKVSDVNDANLTVTLTVGHGTLALSGTTGLSVTGNGTGTVTFSGSITNINSALNGLTYHTTSTNNNVDDILTITTSDGHTGGTDSDTVQIDVICFYPGTLVRTPSGEAAVETLKPGDLVLSSDGREIPVRWLGRQTVSIVFADPIRVLPIRVKVGALADNVPSRDLLVSPDHALLVDGALIQAGALVNGTSIARERDVPKTFTYYHVEVDDHSLILAENTPAETFVDNIDRMGFDNWAEYQALYPEGKQIAELPYPRAKANRQVSVRTRIMLAARAQAIGANTAAVA